MLKKKRAPAVKKEKKAPVVRTKKSSADKSEKKGRGVIGRLVQSLKPRRNRKPKEAAPVLSSFSSDQRPSAAPGPILQKLSEERHFEFPEGYGDNRIVLMIRDPHWLYAYWEINTQRIGEIIKEIGESAFYHSRPLIRVYDTDNWQFFDIEITSGAKNWYIHVPTPNRTYCVDIGFLTPDGKFIAAARSNWVTLPSDRMSDVIDEQWLIPDWEKMYALSGGFGLGKGSEEIREMLRHRLENETSSGWIFSISSPMGKTTAERPFWLVANCELVVYGATEPTAKVTVQGHQIKLRDDGTFSLRFSLPDGQQVIPIEAIRDDGAEKRKIIPIVERKTEQ